MEERAVYRTSESERQAAVVEALLRARALVIRVNSGRAGHVAFNRWGTADTGWQTAGVSDLIVIMPDGAVLFVEAKGEHGRYGDAQDMFRYELQQRGARYMSIEQVYQYLEGTDEAN